MVLETVIIDEESRFVKFDENTPPLRGCAYFVGPKQRWGINWIMGNNFNSVQKYISNDM